MKRLVDDGGGGGGHIARWRLSNKQRACDGTAAMPRGATDGACRIMAAAALALTPGVSARLALLLRSRTAQQCAPSRRTVGTACTSRYVASPPAGGAYTSLTASRIDEVRGANTHCCAAVAAVSCGARRALICDMYKIHERCWRGLCMRAPRREFAICAMSTNCTPTYRHIHIMLRYLRYHARYRKKKKGQIHKSQCANIQRANCARFKRPPCARC